MVCDGRFGEWDVGAVFGRVDDGDGGLSGSGGAALIWDVVIFETSVFVVNDRGAMCNR